MNQSESAFVVVPVYFTVEQITPEHPVGGHVHVQGHSVLQSGNHLRVFAFQQVNATDFMAVGEHQVWTVSFWREEEIVIFLDISLIRVDHVHSVLMTMLLSGSTF